MPTETYYSVETNVENQKAHFDRGLSNKQKISLILAVAFGGVAVSGFFGWVVSETNHARKNEAPNAMVVDKTATLRCSSDRAPVIERKNQAVTIVCQP